MSKTAGQLYEKPEIHADDYAISRNSTADILALIKAGLLDSISVLPNMDCFSEAAELFAANQEAFPKQPLLSVHLNFMEGHCCADLKQIPDLVDAEGRFCISWGQLFWWNYLPGKRAKIQKQLEIEILAQTEKFRKGFGDCYGVTRPLRYDGHQHTQMIPIVYQAILRVIERQHFTADYIRVTREPAAAYLRQISLWGSYRPVNWVKNLLLNFYAGSLERALRKQKKSGPYQAPMYLWGVVMSGCMDKTRVAKLLPGMQAQAQAQGRHLEILFHPGTVLPEELTEEFNNEGANHFHVDKGRRTENEAVRSLHL